MRDAVTQNPTHSTQSAPLRSLLFVPGNRPDMLDKAAGMNPGAFAPDMEDAVTPAEKENAREIIASKIAALAATGHLVIPRVNSIESGLAEDDISALVERIGVDNVLFGSDWPHGEGLADPCSFRNLLAKLSESDVDRIMCGNLTDLIAL